MSTRASIISFGPFHLFKETMEDRLCLDFQGEENRYSGGVYLEKEDLVRFADQVKKWQTTGKEPCWDDEGK